MHPRPLLTLALLLCGFAFGARAAERANVLFIYTDDQGAWTTGASGNEQAHTPNIDRLAGEGTIFSNAFVVTPVCSPARATTLTGRYASEAGIFDWINPRTQPDLGLSPDAFPTWPALLREAGYRTGLFGKWHLGTRPEFHPRRFGFETFFGFLDGGTRPMDAPLEKNGETEVRPGYVEDVLVDEAIEFIRAQRTDPFVVAVHTRAPHRPWQPMPQEDWARFAGLDPAIPEPDYPGLDVGWVKRDMREYLASVASVDRNVGRLLRTLDELGLTDSTIVIFTSDHGYNLGHHGMWGKGNGLYMLEERPAATETIGAGVRPNMFDRSLRVPLVIRWPGTAAAGGVEQRVVTNLDWLPTLLEMAEVSPPPAAQGSPGRSLVPLLRGQRPQFWEEEFYGEYTLLNGSRAELRMWRTPEWKLVRDFLNPGRDELYHLAVDPEESRNLIYSADPLAKRARRTLEAKLLQKMEQLGDPALPSAGPAE